MPKLSFLCPELGGVSIWSYMRNLGRPTSRRAPYWRGGRGARARSAKLQLVIGLEPGRRLWKLQADKHLPTRAANRVCLPFGRKFLSTIVNYCTHINIVVCHVHYVLLHTSIVGEDATAQCAYVNSFKFKDNTLREIWWKNFQDR